ncbi:MAG: VWA domain-containing protein [Candidatus Omnitrophica bacterium]|nr:VWA domain-containing protein [Candidatus Omnitrophota bacterium]
MKSNNRMKTLGGLVALLMTLAPLAANAAQVQLEVALGNPVLLANEKQTTFVKVGLTGFAMQSNEDRPPVNVAIVLDRSGSMSGDKIERAKEAAKMAVDRLSPKDIVSIVTYDHTVNVLLPATKVTDKGYIKNEISKIQPGGNTALFAGVSKGAGEVRKFLEDNRVNRVILLSDGLANVGPSSPGELANLGESLAKEGMAVTTIGLGLGFNEDLMTQLAFKSEGNHYFVAEEAELAKVFNTEFGDVLSVVAQDVVVDIDCREGIRPIRILDREGNIDGQRVNVKIPQIYSNQQKYVLLEVEIPASEEGSTLPIANVSVSYNNMETKTSDDLSSSVSARFSGSRTVVKESVDKDVLVPAVRSIANIANEEAVRYRDEGKMEKAKEALISNQAYLQQQARELEAPTLFDDADENRQDAASLESGDWAMRRKVITERSYQLRTQQQNIAPSKN